MFEPSLFHTIRLTDKLIDKYHKLYQKVKAMRTTGSRKSKIELLKEIGHVAKGIRGAKVAFDERYEKEFEQIPARAMDYVHAYSYYLEAVEEHTIVSDRLSDYFEKWNVFQQIWRIKTIYKAMIELDKITETCIKRGKVVNEKVREYYG